MPIASYLRAVVCLAVLAASPGTSMSASPAAQEPSTQLVILAAQADVNGTTLFIEGRNFTGRSGVPVVTFGGENLPVVSVTDTQIQVAIPAAVAPGPGPAIRCAGR